mmetsp:Transcript_13965/g.55095  ORF Transcript_13965/g.55095 Transcript_13965/m.55095 type:complete len:201 (-) Transcript_13965:445-1047(-)
MRVDSSPPSIQATSSCQLCSSWRRSHSPSPTMSLSERPVKAPSSAAASSTASSRSESENSSSSESVICRSFSATSSRATSSSSRSPPAVAKPLVAWPRCGAAGSSASSSMRKLPTARFEMDIVFMSCIFSPGVRVLWCCAPAPGLGERKPLKMEEPAKSSSMLPPAAAAGWRLMPSLPSCVAGPAAVSPLSPSSLPTVLK